MKMNSQMEFQEVYLLPGDIFIAERPTLVTTVLGSCVSITLFNRRTGVGAITHGVMAKCNEAEDCEHIRMDCFRYVDCAIKHIVRKLEGFGIKKGEMVAKMFGGADLLGASQSRSVGLANVMSALETVEKERLKLVAQDVGDCFGRKIKFYTHNGDVFVNRFKDRRGMTREPEIEASFTSVDLK